ncbi:unnamed protein product [Mytilus coruscus]|uniref:B box-type domain-containing protein n=1 Tax=Mytilus coruscus TaxID=42192 RepID=A0A6J8CJD1_MYTCO|nr:unnamed protein product [Mytilus coruscus]
MALRPLSARRAQVQKKCDLCESNTSIQYRCIQCQKYMCEKCNKIHLNVQTSVKHEIINIRSANTHQDTPTSLVTDFIPCERHNKKFCEAYCPDCIELVCEDCISDTHIEHQVAEINEGCTDAISKFQCRLSKDLWFCENKSKQLQASTQMCNSSYDNARKKIDDREKKMKAAIEKYADQLRAQIETKHDNVEKQRKMSEKKIKDIKDILNDKESTFKRARESNRADKIIKAIREINNNLPKLDFHPLPQDVSDFMSGDITVSELFGSLQSKPITNERFNIDLKVIKSFTTDFNFVDRLLTLDTKTAWISNFAMTTLSKINIDHKMKTLKHISVDVFDMSQTVGKDILLSLLDNTDVSLLTTKTGEIKPFLSVSPLRPRGIHVNKHNDIILGVIEEGDPYKLTDTSCRKVLIFGMDGKQKQSYEYDKHKKRLFTLPVRITSNVSNDILVINSTSDYGGTVLVLDWEGKVKWTYQGNPQVNSENNLFNPYDIVTTSVGHVMVCDFDRHTLHVLSGEGDVLTCKVMEDQGILNPMSMHINTMGHLWVVCDSEYGQSCNAKLHIVKFSS